jgi:hypothetical protein
MGTRLALVLSGGGALAGGVAAAALIVGLLNAACLS